jgi:RES domain-containing protein
MVRLDAHPESVLVQHCRHPPAGWRAEPPQEPSMRYGSNWLRRGRTAVLEVPSAIVPSENNYLLSPQHVDFHRVRIGRPRPFVFDPRMWK